MTKYNIPADVLDYIKGLEKRIEALEQNNSLQRATIDKGFLSLRSPDGKLIAVFGDLNQAGLTLGGQKNQFVRGDGVTDQMGLAFFRDDGSIAFSIYDDSPLAGYQQFWALWDSNNHIIASADADSGNGLALPYIPLGEMLNNDTSKWPSTTSGSFVDAFTVLAFIQQPKVMVDALGYSTDSIPTLRLTVGGTQYGPTVTGTGTGYTSFSQTIALPSSMTKTWQTVSFQYAKSSGPGSVAAAVRGLWGRQT